MFVLSPQGTIYTYFRAEKANLRQDSIKGATGTEIKWQDNGKPKDHLKSYNTSRPGIHNGRKIEEYRGWSRAHSQHPPALIKIFIAT